MSSWLSTSEVSTRVEITEKARRRRPVTARVYVRWRWLVPGSPRLRHVAGGEVGNEGLPAAPAGAGATAATVRRSRWRAALARLPQVVMSHHLRRPVREESKKVQLQLSLAQTRSRSILPSPR